MRALAKFRSNWKNELIGFLLVCIAAIVFLSLSSYDPMDTPMHTSTPNASANNAVGLIGAYGAESLLLLFGISSYLLPVVLLIWAWNTFWGKMGKDIYLKLTGLIMMLLSVSGLCHTFGVSVKGDYFKGGGVLGPYVSHVLGGLFGIVGERVVAATLFVVSVLLTTEFLFVSFAATVAAVLVAALSKAVRFAYEGVTGDSELPGGLSVKTKKRPPKVDKAEEKIAKQKEAAPEPAQREVIKINEPKLPEPSGETEDEAAKERSPAR
ncbi:MAG: DNA translocase FtsK 4TM domain-containing protein, partial [Candidatus Lindowbacteria bacterium]|nr:DNA translocase FtsK 4TM domain-containing protein [Candidatus Lindowbacteria bacterium]